MRFFAQLLNNEKYFTLTSSSAADLYRILNGENSTLQAKESDRLSPFMLMGVGPYDLAANETIKIVLAEAVAGISLSEAMKGLVSQSKLPQGEDLLIESIERAQALYANQYAMRYLPPPAPRLEIIPVPENQSITLNWEAVDEGYLDPLSGEDDFNEYRIYRSSISYIGPFELLRSIRPSRVTDKSRYYDTEKRKWVMEDKSISLGAGYFYAVTSIDKSNRESGKTNRNQTPVYAIREPAANALNVRVFPNPFRITSGFPVSGAENSIVWTNLPAECTVRIYTSNGELIRTLQHNSTVSGEETWDQLTDARQRPAPGIYFWTVASPVGNAQGTLLIIK